MKSPRIAIAANLLLGGGVIAYPTEAVWGLGADPWNPEAVEHILCLKQRPVEKGLILVAASMSQFGFLLNNLSKSQYSKLAMSWPGPFTWLVPHQNRVPEWVCGKYETVAIRVSAHPIVRALCHRFQGPIVSTSANPQGRSPALNALRVRQYFGESVYCVPGAVDTQSRPSVIRDLLTDTVIRA